MTDTHAPRETIRPDRVADARRDHAREEGERPVVDAYDPHFGRLFADGDRLIGVSNDDDRLWAGY